jgi:uncharacterized YigZ family protein
VSSEGYPIPAGDVRVEQEIKRSRFIGTLSHADSRQAAEAFIAQIREEHPQASHNCYAFVAGEPDNTPAVGMSDDGEPRGTAGKPMLAILKHTGVGEVVAVVTRYFGGTKLGTGGLVRAYSGTLQLALGDTPLKTKIELCRLRATVPYHCEGALRRFAQTEGIELLDIHYSDSVSLLLQLPASQASEVNAQLANITNGAATVDRQPLNADN